jgi:uncharacterized protein (DUF1778 family)
MSSTATARFDARITPEQKELFERAAALGGFRSLTEFVVHAAQVQSKQIIEQHDAILANEADRDVFFNALMNPPEPNEYLIAAWRKFKEEAR